MDMLTLQEGRKSKIKAKGLFHLLREAFVSQRQVKEMETIALASKKVFVSLNNLSDLPSTLRYLNEAQELLRKARVSVSKFRERNTRLFEEESIEGQTEEITEEFKIEDTLEFISGLRLLIKIALEGKMQQGTEEEMGILFDWLGFSDHQVGMLVTEEVIGQHSRKVITIESSDFRTWDDMSPNIRKRHLALKKIFERGKGQFYYESFPSKGTKITLKLPLVIG